MTAVAEREACCDRNHCVRLLRKSCDRRIGTARQMAAFQRNQARLRTCSASINARESRRVECRGDEFNQPDTCAVSPTVNVLDDVVW
jgi:hypothetical protein